MGAEGPRPKGGSGGEGKRQGVAADGKRGKSFGVRSANRAKKVTSGGAGEEGGEGGESGLRSKNVSTTSTMPRWGQRIGTGSSWVAGGGDNQRESLATGGKKNRWVALRRTATGDRKKKERAPAKIYQRPVGQRGEGV